MVFEPGKMTGICGETGSGKSTIFQLIERFYEPTSGVIEVDGVDIKTLNLNWWRSNVGFVGQEPVLFDTTIKANIEFGQEGATSNKLRKQQVKPIAWNLLAKSQMVSMESRSRGK